MDCVPELAVSKRKTMSYSRTIKRLRRFVSDNSRQGVDGGTTDANNVPPDAPPAELVCRVSDETMFQLQQIYEALEAKESRRATMTSVNESRVSSGNIANTTTSISAATAEKTPSKKRSRASEDPATEVINRRPKDAGADMERAKKKRKERRKSAAT